MVPNHKILGKTLVEIFYRALNVSSKVVENIIIGGAFMGLHWKVASEILHRVSVTNQGWNNREANRGSCTYAIGTSSEQRIVYNIVA